MRESAGRSPDPAATRSQGLDATRQYGRSQLLSELFDHRHIVHKRKMLLAAS